MLEITLKENGKEYCFAADINKNIELIGGTVAGNGSIGWSNEGISLEKIAEKILGAKSVDILAAAVDDTLYPMDHIITKNHRLRSRRSRCIRSKITARRWHLFIRCCACGLGR